ncbi:MAG: hypothetical protein KZQ99_04970 [Candidatus Thiodiazotropha sp. (ex Dulcina madagascariensis)]|nr:hypothetical protein [Candidatus Thiodiazotropha sp. (ex Dulcina madagascariensis)]
MCIPRLLALLALLLIPTLAVAVADHTGKRVMYLGSYHPEYPWSIGLTQGIKEVLEGSGVTLAIHRMDTKRNRSAEFIREAARQARAEVDAFAPDVVIISDDNAVKYVLQAFYKDAALPFIFCGVNWDASVYSLPYRNTTGMVEVDLISALIRQLRPHARGGRIGYLALEGISSLKNIEWHRRSEGVHYDKIYLVDDFETWKKRYLALQDEVDMVILGNQNGVRGWNTREAVAFTREHTRIPSGALSPGRMAFTLLGYLRLPEEQGRWAAGAALKILDGATPSSIPVVRNQQARVVINHELSQKLGITFSPALFKRAEFVWPYQGRKLLYLSSYHLDVAWSGGVHNGLLKALEGSGVELRKFFMGAKRNQSEGHLRNKALEAKRLIETFAPEVVVTTDDAAAKYIIAAYYKDSKLPFVFTGVNWNAAPYGLPTDNVTGIVEVEMIQLLYKQLKRYAKGPRLGWLSENSLSQRKNIEHHQKLFGIDYDKVYFVETFDDWKEAFLALQEEVDMLVLEAPHAIRDWNLDEAIAFAREHTWILTGGLTENVMPYAVMGYVRLPEEHGEWAARSALRILDGTPPNEIPLAQNIKGRLILNRRLLEHLGLVVDRALYRMAEIVE